MRFLVLLMFTLTCKAGLVTNWYFGTGAICVGGPLPVVCTNFTELVPAMTANTLPSGIAAATVSNSIAWLAFATNAERWQYVNQLDEWNRCYYSFGTKVALTGFYISLSATRTGDEWSFTQITLDGSVDGLTWETITNAAIDNSGQQPASALAWLHNETTNNTTLTNQYQYFRWSDHNTNDIGVKGWKFQLFGCP